MLSLSWFGKLTMKIPPHPELVEGSKHQWHLKRSKGSLQSRQRCSALHGVEPKRLISSVFEEPQRGHCAASSRRLCLAAPFGGGAMPYACSFSRPSSLIQSVVHGGDSTVSIVISASPASSSAVLMSRAIAIVAGQPL